MPMNGDEPAFDRVEPERAHTYLYEESGLEEGDADTFVENKVNAADKALSDIEKQRPKMGTSISEFKKAVDEWQNNVDEAKKQSQYWHGVQDIQEKKKGGSENEPPCLSLEKVDSQSQKKCGNTTVRNGTSITLR